MSLARHNKVWQHVIWGPSRVSYKSRYYSTSTAQNGFDINYDAIVVGSGCAGLTTALVAAKHGLKVLVVEKTKYFGGTTAFSSGGAWIPSNKHQKPLGIEDSIAKAQLYLKSVMRDGYDPVKVGAFLQSAPAMVDWMESNTAVRFFGIPLPDYHVKLDGASSARTVGQLDFDGRKLGSMIRQIRYPLQGYAAFGSMQVNPAHLPAFTQPFKSFSNFALTLRYLLRYAVDMVRYGKGTNMANGNALVGRLMYSAKEEGVELWNNAKALQPVLQSERVVGLRVHHNGEDVVIGARKGVVLASGGFGRSDNAKDVVDHDWCAANSGSVGDGLDIGVKAGGAMPPRNSWNAILVPISVLRRSDGPPRRFPHFADRSKPGCIIVDEHGQRFANESLPYQEFVKAMHEKGIKKAFYIGDRHHLRKYGIGMALPWPYPIWNILRQGYLISAPTVAMLAQKIGISAPRLETTVETFNKYAASGTDLEFSRGENIYDNFFGDQDVRPNPNLKACEAGPFYALPLYPGNASTLYGLKTDEDARVLNKDDQAVAGLFAVGCDQNSVFKGSYPGGGASIGPGMTFGYRAGMRLADMKH